MSEALTIAIVTVVGGIIGSLLTILLTRIFTKPRDDADLVQKALAIADQAIDDLHKEKMLSAERDVERAKKYEEVVERLKTVEAATYGPFRITLDFATKPLSIINQKIELVVVKP